MPRVLLQHSSLETESALHGSPLASMGHARHMVPSCAIDDGDAIARSSWVRQSAARLANANILSSHSRSSQPTLCAGQIGGQGTLCTVPFCAIKDGNAIRQLWVKVSAACLANATILSSRSRSSQETLCARQFCRQGTPCTVQGGLAARAHHAPCRSVWQPGHTARWAVCHCTAGTARAQQEQAGNTMH